jgi:hypothetical protein
MGRRSKQGRARGRGRRMEGKGWMADLKIGPLVLFLLSSTGVVV